MTWPWRHRQAVTARRLAGEAQVAETRQVLHDLGETTWALVAWTERLADVLEDLAEEGPGEEDDDERPAP